MPSNFLSKGETLMQTSDTEYVEVTYNHRNRGQHAVYGAGTGTFYGYRAGGQKFLVHVDDQKAQPTLFVAVPQTPTQPKITYQEPKQAPPVPQPIQQVRVAGVIEAVEKKAFDDRVKEIEAEQEKVLSGDVDNIIKPLDLQTIPGVTPAVARSLQANKLDTKEAILTVGVEGLIEVRGIAEARASAIISYLSEQE
jgi:hypothetical protein